MSDVDLAFRKYWNEAQPLFAISHKTGQPFTQRLTPGQIREVQAQIEAAFKEGWRVRDNLAFQ